MKGDRVVLERQKSGVMLIRIDRPERRNALTYSMLNQLGDLIEEAGHAEDARVLVLTGAGTDFCSGADLRGAAEDERVTGGAEYFLDLDGTAKEPHRLAAQIASWSRRLTFALTRLPIPTIAMIRGAAMGPGFSLALAADLAFASESARLSSMWIRRALVPSFGDLWLLPRMVGHRVAMEILLRGQTLAAQRALELGIVNDVVPDDLLESTTLERAEEFARGPSVAYGLLKKEVYRGLDVGFWESLDATAASEAHNVLTPDVAEAFRAYAERREPRFGET